MKEKEKQTWFWLKKILECSEEGSYHPDQKLNLYFLNYFSYIVKTFLNLKIFNWKSSIQFLSEIKLALQVNSTFQKKKTLKIWFYFNFNFKSV